METLKQPPGGAMQIGVVYPQTELRGDPGAVRRIGRGAEDLGFDHILAYDHVLGAVHAGRTPPLAGPYTEHDPFHDPFVMFAYLAGITERIRFATGVLVLPQRQTVLVARQAAAVARTLICIAWAVMARGQDYADAGEDYYDQRDQRNREHLIRHHQQALARLGCQVTLVPPGDSSPPPGQAA